MVVGGYVYNTNKNRIVIENPKYFHASVSHVEWNTTDIHENLTKNIPHVHGNLSWILNVMNKMDSDNNVANHLKSVLRRKGMTVEILKGLLPEVSPQENDIIR